MARSDQQHIVTRDFLELHATSGEPTCRLPPHMADSTNPSQPLFGDAATNSIPRSPVPADLRSPAGWLYGTSTHAKAQASSPHLAFSGMRRPHWMNAWQQFLSSKSSQNGTDGSYGLGHSKGHENAVVGATFLDRNLPGTSTIIGTNVEKKYFPFQVPSPCEQAVTMRMQQIFRPCSPCPGGQASTASSFPSDGSADVPKGTDIRRISHLSNKLIGAQLTIFYCGKVNVYDDVPREKAQEVMLLAASRGSNSLENCVLPPFDKGSLFSTDAPIVGESTSTGYPAGLALNEPVVPQALPQARKASLARFLERRKERILSKAPYLMEKCFL